jgi:hypothetical protein
VVAASAEVVLEEAEGDVKVASLLNGEGRLRSAGAAGVTGLARKLII